MGTTGPQFSDDDSFCSSTLLDSTGFLELVSVPRGDASASRSEDDEMTPENLDSLDSIDAYVERKRGERAS